MLVDDIALTMHPEVGAKTAIHLIECFGSAEAVFRATPNELITIANLRPTIAESISRKEYHSRAEQELAFCIKHHIRAIPSTDHEYPDLLRECPDYPHLLYVMGKTDLVQTKMISIVGTRNITSYGLKMCDALIREMAALIPDLVIVSGLAYGIDVACHRAALKYGLRTIGVVAHPLNRIYPPQHTDVAREMVRLGGAVLSEFHTGCHTDKSAFVQRNRIIAGLSMGTLIVESAAKGGSLITAQMASGYHRDVMAVPGRIGDRYSEGTNQLIRTNVATMVCSANDIIETMGWETEQQPESCIDPPTLSYPISGTEQAILKYLNQEHPVSIELLSEQSGIPLNELPALLLTLEVAGFVRTLPGRMYQKL